MGMHEPSFNRLAIFKKMCRAQEIKDSFSDLARMLDARHDKHEAIFKLSRDITTDSKRLIFSIHRLLDQKDKEAGLKKLHSSLNDILKLWNKMNNLMKDVKDPALFQRAFSPGLQEFIEALCFLRMIESSDLPTCGEILEITKFQFDHAMSTLFAEICLGVADIAGEVMRFVTNMVSKGNNSYNLPARRFLQLLHLEYISLPPNIARDMNRKIHALKGSMTKVEFLCYVSTLQSREKGEVVGAV